MASSDCNYARNTLIEIYCDLLDVFNSTDFRDEIKSVSKAKVEFDPQIDGRAFDIRAGNFFKYIKEVNKIA